MATILNANDELPLTEFILAMTTRSANILSLDKPEIVEGKTANLCIFDPVTIWTLKAEDLLSKGKNSPLIEQQLKGKVKATIYEGNISFIAN